MYASSLGVSEQRMLGYKEQESWLGLDKRGKNTRKKQNGGERERGGEGGGTVLRSAGQRPP